MILAKIAGHTITSTVSKAGRQFQVMVIIDGNYVASIRKRHKVFWLSHCYGGKCPVWARPFLDRVQWGSHRAIDELRCTIATVLQRAAMVHYGLACTCGKPATGPPGGSGRNQGTDRRGVRRERPVPRVHGVPKVSATGGGGRIPRASQAPLRGQGDKEQGIFGTLVWIDGTAAGWIFEDRRDGSFDVTLTRLGEGQGHPQLLPHHGALRRPGLRVYRSGLDTVGRLEILKRRIRELVTAVGDT